MGKKSIEDLLFGYFAGSLNKAEEEILLKWLQTDPSHREIVSQMSDWWAVAHVPLFVSQRKTEFKKHFNLLQSQAGSSIISRIFFSYGAKKVRQAVLFFLLFTIGVFSYYMVRPDRGNQEKAYFETQVPVGGQSKVVLPDRSVVWLNAGSSLRYGGNLKNKLCEVYLKGEAYFEIRPDSSRPFLVRTEKLDIEVKGTSFNVKAYEEEENIDVALVTGNVDILFNSKKMKERREKLEPNQMIRYNKKNHRAIKTKVKAADACFWIQGGLKFSNSSFIQIAKDLERKFNVRILIESETLKNENFSGSFMAGYSIYDVLKEIDMEHKYKWSQQGNIFTIWDK